MRPAQANMSIPTAQDLFPQAALPQSPPSVNSLNSGPASSVMSTSAVSSAPNQVSVSTYNQCDKMRISFLTEPPSTSTLSPPPNIRGPYNSVYRLKPPQNNLADSHSEQTPESVNGARKEFIRKVMEPCPESGKLSCKICQQVIWGPNGRYHIDKCNILVRLRAQCPPGYELRQVAGVEVCEDYFKKPKPLKPRPAKIEGFVMSNSVRLDNPLVAPTHEELRRGVRTGKKGYVRCVKCNAEVHAPNTRKHMQVCKGFVNPNP